MQPWNVEMRPSNTSSNFAPGARTYISLRLLIIFACMNYLTACFVAAFHENNKPLLLEKNISPKQGILAKTIGDGASEPLQPANEQSVTFDLEFLLRWYRCSKSPALPECDNSSTDSSEGANLEKLSNIIFRPGQEVGGVGQENFRERRTKISFTAESKEDPHEPEQSTIEVGSLTCGDSTNAKGDVNAFDCQGSLLGYKVFLLLRQTSSRVQCLATIKQPINRARRKLYASCRAKGLQRLVTTGSLLGICENLGIKDQYVNVGGCNLVELVEGPSPFDLDTLGFEPQVARVYKPEESTYGIIVKAWPDWQGEGPASGAASLGLIQFLDNLSLPSTTGIVSKSEQLRARLVNARENTYRWLRLTVDFSSRIPPEGFDWFSPILENACFRGAYVCDCLKALRQHPLHDSLAAEDRKKRRLLLGSIDYIYWYEILGIRDPSMSFVNESVWEAAHLYRNPQLYSMLNSISWSPRNHPPGDNDETSGSILRNSESDVFRGSWRQSRPLASSPSHPSLLSREDLLQWAEFTFDPTLSYEFWKDYESHGNSRLKTTNSIINLLGHWFVPKRNRPPADGSGNIDPSTHPLESERRTNQKQTHVEYGSFDQVYSLTGDSIENNDEKSQEHEADSAQDSTGVPAAIYTFEELLEARRAPASFDRDSELRTSFFDAFFHGGSEHVAFTVTGVPSKSGTSYDLDFHCEHYPTLNENGLWLARHACQIRNRNFLHVNKNVKTSDAPGLAFVDLNNPKSLVGPIGLEFEIDFPHRCGVQFLGHLGFDMIFSGTDLVNIGIGFASLHGFRKVWAVDDSRDTDTAAALRSLAFLENSPSFYERMGFVFLQNEKHVAAFRPASCFTVNNGLINTQPGQQYSMAKQDDKALEASEGLCMLAVYDFVVHAPNDMKQAQEDLVALAKHMLADLTFDCRHTLWDSCSSDYPLMGYSPKTQKCIIEEHPVFQELQLIAGDNCTLNSTIGKCSKFARKLCRNPETREMCVKVKRFLYSEFLHLGWVLHSTDPGADHTTRVALEGHSLFHKRLNDIKAGFPEASPNDDSSLQEDRNTAASLLETTGLFTSYDQSSTYWLPPPVVMVDGEWQLTKEGILNRTAGSPPACPAAYAFRLSEKLLRVVRRDQEEFVATSPHL